MPRNVPGIENVVTLQLFVNALLLKSREKTKIQAAPSHCLYCVCGWKLSFLYWYLLFSPSVEVIFLDFFRVLS